MRRLAHGALSVGISLFLGCGREQATVSVAPVPAPPGAKNVLLIVVDDLNTALSAYGHPVVKTPNVEELARRGVLFERAYCQYPLCNPSRASFLSGRRPRTTRIYEQKTRPDAHLPAAAFLPDALHRFGYWTVRAGKIFHDADFEKAFAWDYYAKLNYPVPPPGQPVRPDPQAPAARVEPGGEAGLGLLLEPRPVGPKGRDSLRDKRVVEHVSHQLKRARNKRLLFFFAVAFHRPHLPFEAPAGFFKMYPPESIELPPAAPADAPAVPEAALRGRRFAPPMTDAEARRAIAGYYASVSYMDSQLGALMKTFDRLDVWRDTVVVFTSDHGFHLGEHGLWGKLSFYEEVLRVPLVVVAPGVAGGQRVARPVELVDLYPTIFELAGLPQPEGLEGRSLAPLLADPQAPWERPAGSVLALEGLGRRLARSVTDGRFRYSEWGSSREAELYDLAADPRQLRNLAQDPAFAAERKRLAALLP
ncbi:MAG TPA: sulfatase [Thermoanaerobaculia bacterium]|nr:sulfatase [Thermoanaerobaculia bacterium]